MLGSKAPVAVIFIACLYIAVGILGLGFHFRDSLASPYWGAVIELTEALAAVAGIFMLRGHNWARWLALAWLGAHVVFLAFDNLQKFAVHVVMFVLFAWILFRPEATEFFRRPKNVVAEP